MFLKILILLVLFHKYSARLVITGTSRANPMRRRNMVVNMRPIQENEPIFGRVDVDPKDTPVNSGNNAENPLTLEELAHKIGEYLCDKDKKPSRRLHKKRRRARSSSKDATPQTKSITDTRKNTLIDLENQIIDPIYTAEGARERHQRIKRD